MPTVVSGVTTVRLQKPRPVQAAEIEKGQDSDLSRVHVDRTYGAAVQSPTGSFEKDDCPDSPCHDEHAQGSTKIGAPCLHSLLQKH